MKSKLIKSNALDFLNNTDESYDFALYDPPYNTGDGRYCYSDTISNYIDFLEPILTSTRDHLKESGSIALHISYHELFNVGLLMEKIFGRKNRLSIINWECKFSAQNRVKFISNAIDYVLIYAKNKNHTFYGSLPRTEEMNKKYETINGIKTATIGMGGFHETLDAPHASGNRIFGIQNPYNNKIYYPPTGRNWRRSKEAILALLNENGDFFHITAENTVSISEDKREEYAKHPSSRISFGISNECAPRLITYLDEVQDRRVITNYIHGKDLIDEGSLNIPWQISDHNSHAKTLLKNIVGGDLVFNTPKPLKLTELLITLLCPKDGSVIDTFAGSGTTGHAVLSLNSKEKCNRNFTLVEKEDYIESITKKRLDNVITGKWSTGDKEPLQGEYDFIV